MSTQPGITAWMSGIRTTMVNDPGRQLLEDQIQSTGFLFLEDYLENIMAGPRHDPFIELVKTPGRRKIAAIKLKSATSKKDKYNGPNPMDLDTSPEKENIATTSVAPINTFHQSLLQSRNENRSTPEKIREKSAPKTSKKTKKTAKAKAAASKAKPIRLTVEDEVDIITDEEISGETPANSEFAPPTTVNANDHALPTAPEDVSERIHEQRELSNVLELDERPTRGRSTSRSNVRVSGVSTSRLSSHSKKSSNMLKRLPDDIDMANVMDIDDVTQITMKYNVSSSTSGQSFSTVPLDSPEATKTHSIETEESRPDPSMIVSLAEAVDTSIGLRTETEEQHAEPEPEDAATTPASEMTTHFAGIEQPSPLRKSIRPPKDSTIPLFAAKSSMATHSSWLIKSKEKAAENNAKKSLAPVTTAALANKRKSSEMLELHPTESSKLMDEGRSQKITKLAEESPTKLKLLKDHEKTFFDRFHDESQPIDNGDGDIITRLKEQVAGYSARAGKSMGKSLGGAAASALAEARAAAEAKIAERHGAEGRQAVPAASAQVEPAPLAPFGRVFVRQPSSERVLPLKSGADRRLSVSDLVKDKEVKKSNTGFGNVFRAPPKSTFSQPSSQDVNKAADTSTSTTPPHSPPRPRSPVFRPPPKVLPAVASSAKPTAAFAQNSDAKEPEPIRGLQPLASQPSIFSTQSTFCDPIFDSQVQSWVPSTQGTEFEDHAPYHGEHGYEQQRFDDHDSDMDADESWHLDEKFGETWTPVIVGMKDDSMTWSTAPMRSTREADTGELANSIPSSKAKKQSNVGLAKKKASSLSIRTQSTGDEAYESAKDEDEAEMDVDGVEEAIPSVRLVTPSTHRTGLLPFFNKTQSPAVEAGSGGFFSSATKLMSSVLGGSKKGKEPVKSLQLAAAAAKKQNEEAEKKAVRAKEMEARRQQVIQKKAEESRAREEKKAREEDERRRKEKEKEILMEKKVLRHQGKTLTQMESEASKKRKEPEKVTTTLKPPSKEQKEALATRIGKLIPSSSQTSSTPAGSVIKKPAHPSMGLAKSGGVKAAVSVFESKQTTIPASKEKGKAKEVEVVIKQSSKAGQAEMQARYKAQLLEQKAANAKHKPAQSTENIELPDINSEYSNSDDEEDGVKTFEPPFWAQSPALRTELELQSTLNPDDIFGAIKPLDMEEMFKARSSRFRARTSSANWAGTDELTAHEEKEYARRMGFK